MIYALYTAGFRSGGFTLRGAPLTEPYDEEIDAKDLDFTRVPENKLMIGLTYGTDNYDWGSIVSNVRYNYSDGTWTAAVIGSNLTDERYFASGSAISLSRFAFANQPRSWALELSYNL